MNFWTHWNNFDTQIHINDGSSQFIAIFISVSVIFLSTIFYKKVFDFRYRLLFLVNIFWSSMIILNRTMISGLQISWTYGEQLLLSLIFFIPSIFAILSTYFFYSFLNNNTKNNFSKSSTDSVDLKKLNNLFIALTLSVLLILTLDLAFYGIPLFSFNLGAEVLNLERTAMRMPVLYNIANQMVLLIAIGLSLLQYKYKPARKTLLILFIFYLIHNILTVSRGSTIYFLSVILISYFIFSQDGFLRKIRNISLPVILVLVLFSLVGFLRSAVSDGGLIDNISFSIQVYGMFDEKVPSFIAWFYGYGIINFDSLILCIRTYAETDIQTFKVLENFSPALYGLFISEDNLLLSQTSMELQSVPYVGRFNLITAFGFIGFDYGWLGVYIYSFFIIFLIFLFSKRNFESLNLETRIIFIYLLVSFAFISIANIILSSRFLSFIICLAIFSFLKNIFVLKNDRVLINE